MMMMTINAFQYYNALDASPLKKTIFWQLAIEESYQLLYTLETLLLFMEIELVNYTANVIVSQCISYLELMHACMHACMHG